MRPHDDPSWPHYRDTILEFHGTTLIRVDLREPVGSDARAALAAEGLVSPFAVLTAANPRGRTVAGRQNARRHQRLTTALATMGYPYLGADGVSPDGAHRERGVAAMLRQRDAAELARRYGQSAFFWFDGGAFWLVGALVRVEPIPLPLAFRAPMSGDGSRR
jgi:hypothetical protein